MSRTLFNRIVQEVTNHSSFFRDNIDCTGREGISPLMKCTSALRQLAYGIIPDFLDGYLQISPKSSRLSLDHFCTSVMEIFRPEYLRKPTMTDVVKLYRHHEEKNGFRGIAPKIPFVVNGVTYPWGYYLVDGIYPELVTLVKTIPEPSDDYHKRIRYKQMQEAARKDVERAFGVLKKKWVILANLARSLKKKRIMNMMYTCIILHNMIRKDKGKAISPNWYPEEAHQPDDLERSDEQVRAVMRHIRSAQAHQNLRVDLVEHLSRNA
ncbi:ALP1-like protein [Tanacetum coccineum]|uniref:ALP1-like protein n=1 Tax=Tanacetum coccineum TaxID=301880 RepID=A0ABQ4XHN0_9ASTR